jgi:hypothetical protein
VGFERRRAASIEKPFLLIVPIEVTRCNSFGGVQDRVVCVPVCLCACAKHKRTFGVAEGYPIGQLGLGLGWTGLWAAGCGSRVASELRSVVVGYCSGTASMAIGDWRVASGEWNLDWIEQQSIAICQRQHYHYH